MRRLVLPASVILALAVSLGAILLISQHSAESRSAPPVYEFADIERYDARHEYSPSPRWERLLSADKAGWSLEKLDAVKAYAEASGTDALLVIFNGLVVLDYGRYAERFDLHSVRKSLMSVAYGLYADMGIVDLSKTLSELGIDDAGGLTEVEKSATVADLLTSMSGVFHTAAYETRGMKERRPDRGAYMPGEYWFYNNWDFNALVTIFNKAGGQDFFDVFATRIAAPLGMEQFRLQDTRYYREADKSKHPAYLFRMSALDLARVGLLYLRKGKFGDQQLVSEDWVERSTSVKHAWKQNQPSAGYGYLWQVTKDGFYAAGRGGQRLYVVPKRGLVIVHLADTSGGQKVKNSNVKRLYRMILNAQETRTDVDPMTGIEPDEDGDGQD
ncbi:serine hydrolase domain-containing protein [Arvimicrobium flavum]|uniref:serine hydrolase domain-containing protein n=1 Tax=Arvimicrobium flavum TaxID=3393320 RepID=UPI00237A89DA|nr:serine hydrolase [Mesorhizobium shangrilense]